ncbi:hypothetical protein SUGI_1095630 [Cryptomeria japonica]|nr:hypothetical protein SUGI_1095630 [Cryptomeria japonica]
MNSLEMSATEAKQQSNGVLSTPRYLEDLRTMTRSFSVGSLANMGAVKTCVCAPTTHAGSFRCRLHRMPSALGHTGPRSQEPLPSQAPTPTTL